MHAGFFAPCDLCRVTSRPPTAACTPETASNTAAEGRAATPSNENPAKRFSLECVSKKRRFSTPKWSSYHSRTIKNPRNVTKPRRVCGRRRKESRIIFSGGVYGGENTARLANVRIVHPWCTMRALQRAATPSKDPAKRFSLECVSMTHAQNPAAEAAGLDSFVRETQTIRLSRT